MKGIKLTERIRYMSMKDEEGVIGVMTLLPTKPTRQPIVRSVHTNAEFEAAWNALRDIEELEKVSG